MTDLRDIYILYGSQTGNSEYIAKDLFKKCQNLGISSICQTLNSVKKVDLKSVAKVIIIVCSTTGNGDSPENADGWWRATKLRSVAKDIYADQKYAVLGLGDTNYDKFCYMGKAIDKRLFELGGKRVLDLTCADEAVGLEETVERWKDQILAVLVALNDTNDSNSGKISSINEAVAEGFPEANDEEQKSATDVDSENTTPPAGVLGLAQMTSILALSDQLAIEPEGSLLPKVKATKTDLPDLSFLSISSSAEISPVPHDCWSLDRPFAAPVTTARWLTAAPPPALPWDQARQVVHLELSLADSVMQFQPGDSIAVCAPNTDSTAALLLSRLRLAHPDLRLDMDSLVTIPAQGKGCSRTAASTISLGELLRYKWDLSSPVRRPAVLQLIGCCGPEDALLLKWLCSKGVVGKTLWSHFVEGQRLGLADLLAVTPSCVPTLQQLAHLCSPLPPRLYSIASSHFNGKNSVTIAFSLARYTCPTPDSPTTVHSPIRRSGLCTSYLHRLLAPWLYPNKDVAAPAASVRIFMKPTAVFHLPGSVATPLVLVGPGTGVAPFVGFLEHRFHLELQRRTIKRSSSREECAMKRSPSVEQCLWRECFELEECDLPREDGQVQSFIKSVWPGPVLLFYGCRGEQDYLYREELADRLAEGTLSQLELAMSRVGPSKVYVTHRIAEQGAELCKLLQLGAAVYVCGDGNNMAKDVYAAFKGVLIKDGSMSETQAEEMLQDMKQRRRYVMDIWS